MNTHHFSVGNIKLIILADGSETLDEPSLMGMVPGSPDDFLQAFRNLPQPYSFPYNVLYFESGGERILIDTGGGAAEKPKFGNLLDLLHQEGIAPEQIDKVIISHMHGDHVGGLTADGKAVFPNAKIITPRLEWEHWLESGQAPAERTQLLKEILQPYAGRICYVEDGNTVADGVTVIHLPGHTPGHSGFIIESQGEQLLHMVDALHLQMQIAFPDISPVYDQAPDVSAQSRRMVMERIADERMMALSYHLPFPSLGHMERDGAGFAWKPLG